MTISKTLFITNPKDLSANIPGGVQLCSQEFLDVIRTISEEVIVYKVDVSKSICLRLKRKIKVDSYNLYDFEKHKKNLAEIINKNKIRVVFINKAELIKVSKIIKAIDNNLKVVILSHGNETGDYLHELTHPQKKQGKINLVIKKIRLGLNLFTESYHRHRYVDLVCAMSKEEEAIEKWLGAKNTFFFPRVIKPSPIKWKPQVGKIGFVGTLNHTPNYIALEEICKQLQPGSKLNFNIVGSGEFEGKALANKYPFVKYLGKLNDQELSDEAATWMYFINPIFWHSKGASMKLAQAINWQIPIISTVAGARGYQFKTEILNLVPNKVEDFAREIERLHLNLAQAEIQHQNLQNHRVYTFSKEELSKNFAEKIYGL